MKKKILYAIAPYIAWIYLKLLKYTARYSFKGGEYLDEIRARGEGIIYCSWHSRLIGPLPKHEKDNIAAVISTHGDAEILGKVMTWVGYKTIRGSSNTAGTQALRGILKCAKKGHNISITPDGPKGPPLEVKAGAAYAAMMTGLNVVPIAVGARKKLVLHTWDRMQIPAPFSPMQVVYGKPMKFSRDDEIEEVQRRIKVATDEVTAEADRLVGG